MVDVLRLVFTAEQRAVQVGGLRSKRRESDRPAETNQRATAPGETSGHQHDLEGRPPWRGNTRRGTSVHPVMPATYPQLARAPISEAVLDVTLEPRVAWQESAFQSFCEDAHGEFPDARPIRHVQASVGIGETSTSVESNSPEQIGFICWNEKKNRAVQARVNGFSVNHLRAYEDWSALTTHAKAWWSRYTELLTSERVARCGVRFINQFELPADRDIDQTLRTRPEVSSSLPQEIDEYFQRVVIPFPDGIRAAITQVVPSSSKDPATTGRTLVLDVDVTVDRSIDPASDDLWETFEALRHVKNRCFFESLTKTMLEDFK